MSDGGFDGGGFVYAGKGPSTKRGFILWTVLSLAIAIACLFVEGLALVSLIFFGCAAMFVAGYVIQKSRGTLKR